MTGLFDNLICQSTHPTNQSIDQSRNDLSTNHKERIRYQVIRFICLTLLICLMIQMTVTIINRRLRWRTGWSIDQPNINQSISWLMTCLASITMDRLIDCVVYIDQWSRAAIFIISIDQHINQLYIQTSINQSINQSNGHAALICQTSQFCDETASASQPINQLINWQAEQIISNHLSDSGNSRQWSINQLVNQ